MSKYFKTADGQEFYQEHDAKNHAKTLVDKTVTPPEIDVEVEDIEVNEAKLETGEGSTDGGSTDEDSTGTSDKSPKDDTPKEEAPKEIKFGKMTKVQLIAFAVANALTIDEAATNAVIVESIEAQLIEKNQE